MDRRLLLGGALAALVVLSGCSWVQQTDTPTPAAGPTEDGITVPTFRLENHSRALANTSYAVEMRINVSTNRTRLNRSFAVRSDRETARQLIELQEGPLRADRYVANGSIYTRSRVNGSVAYDNRSLGSGNDTFDAIHRRSVSADRLAGIYQFGEFNESGTVTREGRTLTEYELVETAIGDNATVESASGRVLIDQNGAIRLARVDITGTQDGDPFFVHADYRVTATEAVTVRQPGWLDAARRNATANRSRATPTATATATPGD
jgi:hypothetical protein